MPRFPLLVLVFLVACGRAALPAAPPSPPVPADGRQPDLAPPFPADTTNGARLRARAWVTEDGVRLPETVEGARGQTWQDTTLGVPCVFRGPDDDLRCVPLSFYGDAWGNFGLVPTLAFADASCGGQRLVVGPGVGVDPAAQAYRDAACGARRYASVIHEGSDKIAPGSFGLEGFDTYEVGAPFEGATYFVKRLDDGSCLAVDRRPTDHLFAVARKVEPSELVSGRVARVETGRRLDLVVIAAADGSRQRVSWHDRALDVDCDVQVDVDGISRCLPKLDDGLLLPGLFGDAACGQRAIYEPTSRPRAFLHASDGADGTSRDAIYLAGGVVTGLYQGEGGRCTLVQSAGLEWFHVLVGEVERGTFDTFDDVSPTAGRLSPRLRADGEGATERFPVVLTDTKTKLECALQPTPDGGTRCLPAWMQARYPDSSCSGAAFTTGVIGDPAAPKHGARWSGDLCGGGFELHELGAALAPTAEVYDTSPAGEGCARNPFASDSSALFYNALGPAVPPTAFAAVTLAP
jgi:hypothetical protein